MRDRGDGRDRVEVGAFFGLVAGVLALALVMLWTLGAHLFGRPVAPLAVLRVHAAGIAGYVVVGATTGGLWPLRRTTWGHWLLWLMAAAMLSVTLTCVAHGAVTAWPPEAWPRLALMVPALAWVLGSRRSDAGRAVPGRVAGPRREPPSGER